MKTYDFAIIGAGIFGLTAAIELLKRKYTVAVLNPDTIPHHLAASTDISKVVRMEYGRDRAYFDMAEASIKEWRNWNDLFGLTLYHEVGFLMLTKDGLDSDTQIYEQSSFQNLQDKKYKTDRLNRSDLHTRFPALNSEYFKEANFNKIGGYVESGLVIKTLADHARQLGTELYEHQTATRFTSNKQGANVHTKEGLSLSCGHIIVSAGAHTPYLFPELQPFMKATGHPVFHIRPSKPNLFTPPLMGVFTADISNTGWYGFPLHPKEGVVKVAKHSKGIPIHPDKDDRRVKDADVEELRHFLKNTFPVLAEDPVVFTRRCLYTDTLDGHFWIDRHPDMQNISFATGGSGHAMKMGPILGELVADMVENRDNPALERFRWRDLSEDTVQEEEARFVEGGKL